MSEKAPWVSVVGPIAYLDDADFKDQKMRRATIKSLTSGKYVRCTIWPQFNNTPLNLGDWIFVEGPGEIYSYEDKEGNPRESFQVSVRRLATLSPVVPEETPRPEQNMPKF